MSVNGAKGPEEIMRTFSKILGVVLFVVLLFLSFSLTIHAQEYKWYKGQTHMHTKNSDGDSYPQEVVTWYKDHGYNFIVLSDHNHITPAIYYDVNPNDDLILIEGEEVTDNFNKIPCHVNALNIHTLVNPQGGNSVIETLQRNSNAILQAGGVPQINHPNWRWSFGAEELKALSGVVLFELWNVSYSSNNFGGSGKPSMEEIWDDVLTSGKIMYGLATDDMHDLKGEYLWQYANPGRGWIVVRAKELTPASIINALLNGDFYSTTGVSLADYQVTKEKMIVTLPENPQLGNTVFFIGKNGKVLSKSVENPAVYTFSGDEMYVRAKVISSDGETAFLQPYLLNR